jgi:BCD family chlorophyll transporter-like MFS transporter
MNRAGRGLMRAWIGLGPRYLPFADAAAAGLPLGRLLRLSLFQVSVGMCLVLVVGTLNRVMIVELGIAASLVAAMIALPLLAAPFRALIGFRSDNHRSDLGWRRVPFMYRGAMLQFGGLSIMPFALLVMAGIGKSAATPAWVGLLAAAVAFLLVGAGMHIIQTVGLALATDMAEPEAQPSVVGLMCAMQLLGMVAAALLFGAALSDFTARTPGAGDPGRGGGDAAAEPRSRSGSRNRGACPAPRGQGTTEFRTAWAGFVAGGAGDAAPPRARPRHARLRDGRRAGRALWGGGAGARRRRHHPADRGAGLRRAGRSRTRLGRACARAGFRSGSRRAGCSRGSPALRRWSWPRRRARR